MGETQERERVLIHFSNRYYQCNPSIIASQGTANMISLQLSYLININMKMLLNRLVFHTRLKVVFFFVH